MTDQSNTSITNEKQTSSSQALPLGTNTSFSQIYNTSMQVRQIMGQNRTEETLQKVQKCAGPTAVRRLARRSGVKRIASDVYEEVRQAMLEFVDKTVKHAMTYSEYNQRKTINLNDVLQALRHIGHPIYGYGV